MHFLKLNKVADLAGCSPDTVRRDGDAGVIPMVRADRERLFEVPPATLYAANKRFKLDLKGFTAEDAKRLADAVTMATASVAAESYSLITKFHNLTDERGREALEAAIDQKLRVCDAASRFDRGEPLKRS
jgi:hypothetical protein